MTIQFQLINIRHNWRWCFHTVTAAIKHPPQGRRWYLRAGPVEMWRLADCTCC